MVVFRYPLLCRLKGTFVGNSFKRTFTNESPIRREYFYYVSDQGNLYVISQDETKMPYGPAHLRDGQFLDFFFNRIEKNTTGNHTKKFSHMSLCMGEYNFVRSADRPIVYHSLVNFEDYRKNYAKRERKQWKLNTSDWVLVYAASLFVKFQPSQLSISEQGRLYHPNSLGYDGLLRVSIAEQLCDNLQMGPDGKWIFEWQNEKYSVPEYRGNDENCGVIPNHPRFP